MQHIIIYTDGACMNNPKGPGGYGAVLLTKVNGKPYRKEFSKGYSNTTNNRMELMGVAVALEALNKPCKVKVHTDSKYIVNSINEGWAERWKRYGWYKSPKAKQRPKNIDLWKRILAAMEPHEMEVVWVKGHAGIKENERCDELATTAAQGKDLEVDQVEEEGPQLLF